MKLATAILAGAVSALKIRDEDCDNEWFYENCSQKYKREKCFLEATPTDCGAWYWSWDDFDQYWVECEVYMFDWEACWIALTGDNYCD